MKNTAACILLLLFSAFNCVGQSYIIKGSVSDTVNSNKLFLSSVVLIRTSDSVIETSTRTTDSGRFELRVGKPGKYILRATFPSFADYVDVVTVKDSLTIIGDIAMLSKAHLMQEFVITRQIAAIKIKGDTTEYVADSFKVKDNANVEDLLKKLPGIQVDRNGQITAQGEKVQKILVDGEEFFSDDPKVVTQGLQANAIDKVQVYDKKSDQAAFSGIDDGQKTKTINLELKEDRKHGYFGKIDAGGGTDGYFQDQGMVNAFKGKRQFSAFAITSNTDKVGLGWNDNDKFGGGVNTQIDDNGDYTITGADELGGWSGTYSGQGLPKVWTGGVHFADRWDEDKDHTTGNYRYALQDIEVDGDRTSQSALAGDTSRITTEHKNQFSRGERHGLNFMFDRKIDTNTSVQVTIDGGTKTADNSTLSHSETWNRTTADLPKTTNDQTNTGTINSQYLNTDLIFRKKFVKKGRTLSIDVKENYNDSKGNGHLLSTIATPDYLGNMDTLRTDQKKISNSNTLAFAAKATYTEPLSKTTFIEFDYGVTVNNSISENYSYDKNPLSGDYTALNDTFSSHYQYNILSNKGGVFFKFMNKKLNFSFGTDASNTNYLQSDLLNNVANRKYSYPNLYPKANLNYKIAKQTNISFTYTGNTRQPTINQIQPLAQNTDPLNITVGNPALKQEFTNRFNLRFNDYKILTHRYTYMGLTFSNTSDAISTSQVINGPVSTTQYINVNGNFSASGYAGYGFKLNKPDLSIGFSADGSTSHINNFINYQKNISDNNSLTIGPNFSYDKDDKYNFSLEPGVTWNDNTSTINQVPVNYWVFNTQFEGNYQFTKKWEAGSDVNMMIRQETPVFTSNNQVTKWNAYVSRKFLKKNNLELKAILYDILNQNTGFTRSATGSTISQDSYNTIRRYFMLRLVWNFNHTPVSAP